MDNDTLSKASSSMVGAAIVAILAVVFVALRFYARRHYKSGIAWDDWWILIGLVITLLEGALLLASVSINAKAKDATAAVSDNKIPTNDAAKHMTYFQLSFICSILYFSNVTAIKISILLMYRRLFYIDTTFRRQFMLLGTAILTFWLAGTVAAICHCRPISFNWADRSMQRNCFNFNIFWMVTGVVEVIMDTAILALPVRMVLGLHLPCIRKFSVVCVFLLGSFVIVTGILRVVYGYVPGSQSPSLMKAGLWSAVHVGMAIVCACLPPLRPLFTSASNLISNTTSSRQDRYSGLHVSSSRSSKGDSDSDPSAGSRKEDKVEVLPVECQEPYCGATLKNPCVEAVYLEGGRMS